MAEVFGIDRAGTKGEEEARSAVRQGKLKLFTVGHLKGRVNIDEWPLALLQTTSEDEGFPDH